MKEDVNLKSTSPTECAGCCVGKQEGRSRARGHGACGSGCMGGGGLGKKTGDVSRTTV